MWKTLATLVSLSLTTITALNCNICGPGTQNIMGEPLGVVTLVYGGEEYKQNCQKWQASLMISEEWCEENMIGYTYDICKCVRPDGSLLKDFIVFPTASPAPTSEDPLQSGSPGNVQPVALPPSGGEQEPASSSFSASVVLGVAVSLGVMWTV